MLVVERVHRVARQHEQWSPFAGLSSVFDQDQSVAEWISSRR
jgi:hypothetical protein